MYIFIDSRCLEEGERFLVFFVDGQTKHSTKINVNYSTSIHSQEINVLINTCPPMLVFVPIFLDYCIEQTYGSMPYVNMRHIIKTRAGQEKLKWFLTILNSQFWNLYIRWISQNISWSNGHIHHLLKVTFSHSFFCSFVRLRQRGVWGQVVESHIYLSYHLFDTLWTLENNVGSKDLLKGFNRLFTLPKQLGFPLSLFHPTFHGAFAIPV